MYIHIHRYIDRCCTLRRRCHHRCAKLAFVGAKHLMITLHCVILMCIYIYIYIYIYRQREIDR